MALEIKNDTIIGTINNLQEKLNGELPINGSELLYLINSWGREEEFDTNDNIKIPKCEAKECYDLSKLDTSEITDMSQLFQRSKFNGDISNWDVSNVTDMHGMFEEAWNFNQALNDWDVSNVTNMSGMFSNAFKFNQALNSWDVSNVKNMYMMFYNARDFNQVLNNWDVSKVKNMDYIFHDAIAFEKRFNNENSLPNDNNELKVWFNSDRMLAIDIKEREKDNLDSFYNNLESLYNNLDK